MKLRPQAAIKIKSQESPQWLQAMRNLQTDFESTKILQNEVDSLILALDGQ